MLKRSKQPIDTITRSGGNSVVAHDAETVGQCAHIEARVFPENGAAVRHESNSRFSVGRSSIEGLKLKKSISLQVYNAKIWSYVRGRKDAVAILLFIAFPWHT